MRNVRYIVYVSDHSHKEDSIDYEVERSPRKPIVAVIPTKTGRHIICHPFNIIEFSNKACGATCTDGLIKKNNSTLLYENVKHS